MSKANEETSQVGRLVINRFVYHYCCHYQQSVSQIAYIDGVAQMEKQIKCMEDYVKLKQLIDAENATKMVIDSLSFLGMEKGL